MEVEEDSTSFLKTWNLFRGYWIIELYISIGQWDTASCWTIFRPKLFYDWKEFEQIPWQFRAIKMMKGEWKGLMTKSLFFCFWRISMNFGRKLHLMPSKIILYKKHEKNVVLLLQSQLLSWPLTTAAHVTTWFFPIESPLRAIVNKNKTCSHRICRWAPQASRELFLRTNTLLIWCYACGAEEKFL